MEQGFFCAICFQTDSALDPLRDDPQFQTLQGLADARHLAFAERCGLTPEIDP